MDKRCTRLQIDCRLDDLLSKSAVIAEGQDFISSKQLAHLLGLSPAWVQEARRGAYGPPFVKLGSRVVYPVPALIEFLKERLRLRTDEGPRYFKRSVKRERLDAPKEPAMP